jgi:branched-chain amino acid transport system substrate-binding protein
MTVRRPSHPRPRRLLAGVALVPALALLAACTGGDDDGPAAAAGQELKIGLLAPLEGGDAGAGADARHGAELAVEVINGLNPSIPLPLAAQSGLPHLGGAKVSLVVANIAPQPKDPTQPVDPQVTAGDAVSKLVSTDGVDALVGAYDPEVTEYASQRSERYEVPFVNADSPATYLTDAGRNWFFRIGPSWRSAGEAFYSLLRETGAKPGRTAVLYANDKAGQDVVTTAGDLAGEGAAGEVKPFGFTPGRNVTATVDALIGYQPDTVFVYATPADMTAVVQAIGARAWKPKAMLSFSLGYAKAEDYAGNPAAVDGLLRAVSWSKEAAERNPAAQAVTQLYQRKYNAPMSEAAASAFTAVMTVAQAVDAAGTTDNQQVRSSLLSLDIPGEQTIMPWAGVQFDETHQNTLAQALIEQYTNRAFTIVYPRDATAGNDTKLVYPAPNSVGG